MVTYAYLRMFSDLRRAVIMDVVIPGIDPREQVLRNPYLWHFAFHSIPELPERLVQGHQGEYFDYFYDAISADPSKITGEARALYAQAYATDSALTAGFNWYRTFPQDAEANKDAKSQASMATPLLYLRGEKEAARLTTTRIAVGGMTQSSVRCSRTPDTSRRKRRRKTRGV